MKRFTTFLQESQESHVIMTFGRFNPPTHGHDLVMNKVYELTETYQAPHHVFLSRSHDSSKNPLDPETKLAFVNECWPYANIELATKEHPGIIQLAEKINGSHTHLHVVAGQDRVQEYQTLLDRYNGKGYHYESITVHSAGDRNSMDEGVKGVSASKMREYAKEGNYEAFEWCCSNEMEQPTCEALYHAVRKGMNIVEESTGKALFLTGGPGSGKDLILRPMLQLATELAPSQLLNKQYLLETKTPIIINGAYESEKDLAKAKALIEAYGYETKLVYVFTSDHVSKMRNESRFGKGRVISENTRKQKYEQTTNLMQNLWNKKTIFTEEQMYILVNEVTNPNDLDLEPLLTELYNFFNGADINPLFEQFLNELFQHGYPIVPDDQNPINRNIPVVGKKTKGKSVNPKNFQSSVDRNNSVPGSGIGYDFSIRGAEGSAPAGGIGDASYRESFEMQEDLDGSMSMIGGGGNSEPMVTPGEKVVDQMTATATPPTKKKSFRELRNANK